MSNIVIFGSFETIVSLTCQAEKSVPGNSQKKKCFSTTQPYSYKLLYLSIFIARSNISLQQTASCFISTFNTHMLIKLLTVSTFWQNESKYTINCVLYSVTDYFTTKGPSPENRLLLLFSRLQCV